MKRVVALLGQGPRRIQSASAAPSCLREKERTVRRRAVAFHRAFPGRDAAGDLLLSDRTLREWTSRWKEDGLLSVSRGRPTTAASDAERAKMFGLLYLLGSGTGFAVMKPFFPTLSRQEGRSLLHRMRRLLRRLDRDGELALEWLAPGSVYALDFTDPPAPIDGCFPRLLLVRCGVPGNSFRFHRALGG